MKTLYISLAWLIIIILIWFLVFYFFIDSSIKYFFTEVYTLYDSVMRENYIEARPIIDGIVKKWDNTEKIWIYFVNQTEVDNIKSSIQKIDNYIKTENQAMALLEIEELKKFLRFVRGNESLSWENIF